ncbi:unnamed protein product [Symbiodinium sp. CCMP2592]|nr:unnamed protein product [Symbiodinium sp. CCMP2592]CAE7538215.1 unnamed protein product [Symbiodinium sp. CCMP2592]
MFGARGSFGKGKKGSWGSGAWSAANKGKGSGWGYDAPAGRGKGKGYSAYEQGDWMSWSAPAEAEEPHGAKRRLLSRELMVKKLLRPYASASGSFLYSDDNDIELLSKQSLRSLLNADTSELSRRPAYGFSMMATSVRTLGDRLLDDKSKAAVTKLTALFATATGKEFLDHLQSLDFEKAKADPKSHETAFTDVFAFYKAHKKLLYEHLPTLAAHGACLYVGALHALDALVKADALAAWAGQIPVDQFIQKALDKFKTRTPDPASAGAFLVEAYQARKRSEGAWKRTGDVRGDDSDDAAGPGVGVDSAPSHTESSSSTLKPPNGVLTIRRPTGVNADGRMIVHDTDLKETVELEANETVEDAVGRLFKAQGSEADVGNWNVYMLGEDGVMHTISAATTPAELYGEVALVRKGG